MLRYLLQRVRSDETSQLLALLLLLLSLVFAFSWPSVAAPENTSWYAVMLTSRFILGLFALLHGLQFAAAAPSERLAAALLLPFLALAAAPIEVAAYAATWPAVPLASSLLLGATLPVALYGYALLLGVLSRKLRVPWLAWLLVPALLAGLVAVEVLLGTSLVSSVLGRGWQQVLFSTAGAALTILLLLLDVHQTGVQRTGGQQDREVA